MCNGDEANYSVRNGSSKTDVQTRQSKGACSVVVSFCAVKEAGRVCHVARAIFRLKDTQFPAKIHRIVCPSTSMLVFSPNCLSIIKRLCCQKSLTKQQNLAQIEATFEQA